MNLRVPKINITIPLEFSAHLTLPLMCLHSRPSASAPRTRMAMALPSPADPTTCTIGLKALPPGWDAGAGQEGCCGLPACTRHEVICE